MPSETLLGIPKEYTFLLIGLVAGLLLGGWIGRAWGIAAHAARAMTGQADTLREAGLPQGVSLVVNGRKIDVPAEVMAEIQGLLRSGNANEALKVLRQASGLGMEEAKAVLGSLETVMH